MATKSTPHLTNVFPLHLESTRGPSSTSLLLLASLRDDVRLNAETKVSKMHTQSCSDSSDADRSRLAHSPGAHLLVLVGSHTEVLDSLTRVLGSTKKESSGTGRLAESKLVESQALSTVGLNASAGGTGEAEGGDRELGNLGQADVVSDGGDGDNGVLVGVGRVGLGDLAGDARDRNRGTVDLGHVQAAEDDLVEPRVGTAGQKAVKL